MSPAAQRIAFAEATGWTRKGDSWWSHPTKEDAIMLGSPGHLAGSIDHLMPDPLADLNVVHSAVDYLNATQPDHWDDEHFLIILCAWNNGYAHRATAAQWTEAIMRTLGTWDDDK